MGGKHHIKLKGAQRETEPYLVSKNQMMELFENNRTVFQNIADGLASEQKIIQFQYNSNDGLEEVNRVFMEVYDHADVISDITYIIDGLHMTNIVKVDDGVRIFQYKPVIYSDIFIGMMYSYDTKQWKYYYQHDYINCHHNKFIYKIYDLLYNSNWQEYPSQSSFRYM